jgi:hypothetical protein
MGKLTPQNADGTPFATAAPEGRAEKKRGAAKVDEGRHRAAPEPGNLATLVDLVVQVFSDCDRSALDSRLQYHEFHLIVSYSATVNTCTDPQKRRCPNISATPFS